MIGYTLAMARQNAAADVRKPGVRIGRQCIAHDIPVDTIATVAGVSRTAVYNWFVGAYNPRARTIEKIDAYLKTRSVPL